MVIAVSGVLSQTPRYYDLYCVLVSVTQNPNGTVLNKVLGLNGKSGQPMTPCDAYAKWLESHYAAVLDVYGFSVVFEIVVSLKAGGISKVNRILRDSEFDLYFATVLIDLARINSEKYIGSNS